MSRRYTYVGSVGMGIQKALLAGLALILASQQSLGAQTTASVYNGSAGDQRGLVSVEFNSTPLGDALHALARKATVGISYDSEAMPQKTITYRAKDTPVFKALEAILSGTGLVATLSENRKVILIKEEPVLQRAVQQETITGTVTDGQTGEPLPGVNILVKGTTTGTSTDSEGNFELTVESLQDTLVVTFIGYQRHEVPINGRSTVDISMQTQTISGEELVVTALGIEREERALGYSVSTVETEQLENKGQSDISRTLRGKISGVNITQTSGVAGTATDFVIRGYSTISGSNQPLFIVDGVQFDISSNSSSGFDKGGALSQTSRLLDLNTNNIKNINVLKGLSATTIYGEKGRNGVVIVTTKNGSFQEDPGFEVTINQSIYGNKIASLPDYQNSYGGGIDQNYGSYFSTWGPAFNSDLSNKSYFIRREDDGTNIIKHPYSQFSNDMLKIAFPQFQAGGDKYEYAYRPYENVERFFRTGTNTSTNFNISGGTQNIAVNLNVGRDYNKGFTPGNILTKNNVGLGINSKLFEGLTIKTTANLALTDMKTPPIASSFCCSASTSGRGSVFGDVFYTPRSIDLNGLPFKNPLTGGSVYYRTGNDIQHPYWTIENEKSIDNTKRIFGKGEISYNIIEGLNASYRVGLDTYEEHTAFQLNKGGVNNTTLTPGYYQSRTIQNTIWDNSLYLNYNKDLTDQFSLEGLVGGQLVIEKYEQDGLASQEQVTFDLFRHANFKSHAATNFFSGNDFQFRRRQETGGIFMDATLGFEDYIYVNLSGRNDWFSTLEPKNKSQFYPSASVSFIPSEVFDIKNGLLNYLKIRAGIGTSAGAPDPYSTRTTLNSNSRAFINPNGSVITTLHTSNKLGNRNLKPELITEYELGIESQLFDSRVGLNVSVYSRITSDLITGAQLDPAVGYTTTEINIGEVLNRGLEVDLNTTPIQGPFQWSSNFHFFAYKSEVNDLGSNLDQIQIAGLSDLGNYAIPGKPLNIMQGTRVARDEQNRRLVDSNGNYKFADEIGIIGDPNPDFSLTSDNNFNYKNFSLTAQIDFQKGGDLFSSTIATLLGRGLTTDTDFDRQVPLVMPGFKENGQPNDIQITANQAYLNNVGIFAPRELSVYDGTNIRISEVSLSYRLPESILSSKSVKQISITLSGFNLWYFTPYMPKGVNLDPNVSGTGADNGLGFDFLAGPSSRRFGGNISIEF